MLYIEVVEFSTGMVVKRLGPMSEQKAEKVDGGLNINLNHNEYYTRTVSETGCR